MARIVTAAEAVAAIPEGASILMGGFGLCGIPENLIKALAAAGTRNLTVMSNNAGVDDYGIGLLLANKQVRRMVGTYVGENAVLERMILDKDIDIELVPQGTFAERIRAAGAGIPAFYTPTGVGTLVAEGKETRDFGGREFVLERALHADFAFIKAYQADAAGNLVYRATTRNFNPMMATAGRVTIAEVEEIVERGRIDPENVVTPGIFVDQLVRGEVYE
jgi:3-oxoacid CoA-transferase subunit A